MLFFPECVARVPVSLWGSRGWGCVRSTLRLRPQPSATVRNRPREGRMAMPMVSSAKGVTFGGFKHRVASFRVAGVALCDAQTCFAHVSGSVSKVILSGRRNTPHSTLYTLHSTLCTLHSTLCTLHSTLHTLHFTLHTWHFTFHITFHTPHFTLYTPLFCIPQSTVRWHGNRGNMYKIVQLICFTKVFYVTAFGFVGCMLLLWNL